MEEGLQNIFYIVLAIVFWLGPALLRWLRKRAASSATAAAPGPARPAEAPAPPDEPFGWDGEQAADEDEPDFAAQAAAIQEELRERARAALRAQRSNPARGGTLGLLDKAAADLFAPYAALLRRSHPALGSARVQVLEGSWEAADALTDPGTGSVVAALPERASERPATFALLAGGTARAALEVWPGLLPEARRVLGLPDPESAAAYLAATGRITIPALISAWLPALLADALATAQLGAAYVAALARSAGRSVDAEAALGTTVDGRARIGGPPLHVRMYVACLALDRLGGAEESGARWTRWNQALETPDHLLLHSEGFGAVRIEAGGILAAAATVVDGLLGRGLPSLSGSAPAGIPGLRMGGDLADRILAVAGALSAGEVVAAEPRAVLAAATLAAERAGHVETRIHKAALDSLAGRRPAPVRPPVAQDRREAFAPASDLASLLHTPGFAARAVALAAAVSPKRGGRPWAGVGNKHL